MRAVAPLHTPENGDEVMFWMKRNLATARTPRTTVLLAAGGLTALNVVMTVTAQQPKAPAGQASVGVAPSSVASAGAKGDGQSIDLPPGSFEALPNGYRRVYHSQTQSLSADDLAQLIAAGKTEGLNGKQRVMSTFTDYLPENWMEAARQAVPGARVDSYGNPIVNEPFALPGWAQRDVDALRDEIVDWLLHMDNLELALAGQADQIVQIPPRARPETYQRDPANLETDLFESQHILGNYVAQAIVRQIDISDLMPLDHPRMTPDVVNSLARYFHFYEGVKAEEASRTGVAWSPEVYPAAVVALLESHGHAMQDVLSLEIPEDEGGIAGAGGCYNRIPSAPGATFHVDAIGIWNGIDTSVDDAQADIPIGFRHYYQPCETGFFNNFVRVSSNGYISFFEQGGNAVNGTLFGNQPLPSAGGVDGFAAPWWDDLHIVNQGTLDEVAYKLEGAVGFRVLAVEWWSVSHFGGSAGEFYYFQARLTENNGALQFHYDHTAYSPDPTVDSRTGGIENFAGNAANCADNCNGDNIGVPTSNYTYGFPAMPNDGCLSAQCLEEGEIALGNNFGAGGSDLSTCVPIDFPDVWYTFRAPNTNFDIATVSLCNPGGNEYDSSLSVFDACNGNQLACNDDSCLVSSSVSFNTTPGVNYLLRVSGFDNSRGTFAIRVSMNEGAHGDTCFDPIPLSIPGTGPGVETTADNTGCNDESTCAGSSDTIDEWLAWTAPSTGQVAASTCAGSTNFDTTLAVYSGPCGSLAQLACNDDFEVCNGQATSRVEWNAVAGTTYLLRVAGWGGATGQYDIEIGYDETCPGDVAPSGGDGVVDVDDLVAVILAWGPCSGCPEDFVPAGGDSQVDVDDLVGVILAWGICP
jgi:hypothetical protein